MSSSCTYAKESATSLSQPPKISETQFQDTDPTSQRRTLSERNHMRLWHVKEVHGWHRMLWANRRYTQDMHRPDHTPWGHMNNTAHMRGSEKVTKKQVMFPMIYANHSHCPGNHTIQHSIKVPVSTCSSDIILSLYFLWNSFDEKWVIFLPTQAGACGMHSFGAVFWGKAPPSGSSRPYFHTTQERMLQSKLIDEGFFVELGMRLGTEYKLATPVGHTVERMK